MVTIPWFQKGIQQKWQPLLPVQQWAFGPIGSLWVESTTKTNSLLLGSRGFLLHDVWNSSINLYGDIKYKFYIDLILTCYRQATLPKMFSHVHLSLFRECSMPISETEQNYHMLFLDVSNLWLTLPSQNSVPNSWFQNQASLLDKVWRKEEKISCNPNNITRSASLQ